MAEFDESQLSDRQKGLLIAIADLKQRNGMSPTMREIADEVGLKSVSSVSYQLGELEKAGAIEKQDKLSRGISISGEEEPVRSVAVPLVGQIAAGTGLLAEQSTEDTFALPEQLVGKGQLFMLKVKGESMIDAAICDGDFVVVRAQQTADNGDIVAALLPGDEEATVKVFKQRDGHTWLLPRNSAFEPILGDQAKVMGVVVTVLRKL
ncbi:MAG: LexA repressor [Actinomycetota bacterium]|jgi:repressor LexA